MPARAPRFFVHRLSLAQGARSNPYALSTLSPGRFLMPGDLEGSPALTFTPLRVDDGGGVALLVPRRNYGAALRIG